MVNYHRYLRLAKRFIWILFAATFLCGAGSYFISAFVLVPEYQVTSTVLVYKLDNGKQELYYGNILANEKLVGTFRDIASSRRVLDKVIRDLKLNSTINALAGQVSIHIPSSSQILSITVRNTDNKQAIAIANAMAYAFQDEMKSIIPDQHVVIIDLAQDIGAISAISPNIRLTVVLGAFFGFLTCSFILFVIEFLRATIRSEAEAQAAAGAPVLLSVGKLIKTDR